MSMTENRAIEVLEYIRKTGNGEAPYVGCAQDIAIDIAIKALEKQIPKKPTNKHKILDVIGFCPSCKIRVYYSDQTHYCPKCGQKLDWEGGE